MVPSGDSLKYHVISVWKIPLLSVVMLQVSSRDSRSITDILFLVMNTSKAAELGVRDEGNKIKDYC